MVDPSDSLNRLERKVDRLTWVVSIQTVLIGIVAIAYLMRMAGYLLIVLVVALPLLYLMRGSLPALARRLGQLVGRVERRFREKVGDPPAS